MRVFYSILIMALAIASVLPATPVLACNPLIDIEKTTLGCDGQYGDAVYVTAGTTVTWKYKVRNIGENGSYLTMINVTDNMGVTPTYSSGDNGDGMLQKGEVWIYYATGTAISGNYSNTGTTTGQYGSSTYTDSDDSSYFGGSPGINIEKTTKGDNGLYGDGVYVTAGDPVEWKYEVTNTGDVALSNITVTDNMGVNPIYVSGDDGDGLLENGEAWIYSATGTAVSGSYSNTGTATGKWVCLDVNSNDSSSYYNSNGGNPQDDPEVGGEIYPINKIMLLTPVVLAVLLLSGGGVITLCRQTKR